LGVITRLSWRSALLIGTETVLIVGSVVAASFIRLGAEAAETVGTTGGLARAWLIALVCQVSLYYADLYDLRVVADRRELFVRMLQALGGTSLILALLYYWFPGLVIGRGVFLVAAALVAAFIICWRLAFTWVARHARPRERLLVAGTGPAAVELVRELLDRREELGVEIVGFVDPDPETAGEAPANPGVIGLLGDIPRIVAEHNVDRVVVSMADARGRLPMDDLLRMKLNDGVRFAHLATVYEEYTGKIAIENLRPSWFIFSEGFRKSRRRLAGKRAVDFVAAAVGLALASPVLLACAALVRLTSAGPAIYRQQRVGMHGRVFTILKFRSMRQDAEAATGAVWARPGHDPRTTAVGRILRRTRLDELPQLWNVLRGDMSLVGPRPERPEFVEGLTRDIPYYGQRHVVRPGLTGWAQVRYAYGASAEDAMQKLQYDLYYIKNMSPGLDWFILLETIKTVLIRGGS
jgi:sugar transferase (PEP-CTERM system associated)